MIHQRTISPLMLVQTLIQVAWSLRFLKNIHIAHLDIKPGNLLVGKGTIIKTSDLGEAYVYLERDTEKRT
jgi:serine/threonine protein kinase